MHMYSPLQTAQTPMCVSFAIVCMSIRVRDCACVCVRDTVCAECVYKNSVAIIVPTAFTSQLAHTHHLTFGTSADVRDANSSIRNSRLESLIQEFLIRHAFHSF